MKLTIVYLAALGFLVSASAHLAAFFGIILGGEGLLFTYFAGAIILFLPTVFTLSKEYPNWGRKFTWADILVDCPGPVKALFYGVFFYAFASFVFLWSQGVKTQHHSGESLTANTARGFSGHAMAFYMASIAIMLSLHRAEKKTPKQ